MSVFREIITPAIVLIIYVSLSITIIVLTYIAVRNGWTKKYRFIIKYKILRYSYPISIVEWCIENMENGIGYWDTKKFLMVKNHPQKEINEILWIYAQLLKEMKGGIDKNGRKFKGISDETENEKELPKYSTDYLKKG
jgi:hypothetical protein